MRKAYYYPALLLLLVLSATPLAAQSLTGQYPEAWLRRDVGARAIGMLGAYTAVSNEPAALYYNPGGLAFLSPRAQVAAMTTSMGVGRSQHFLSWGQSFGELIGVGAGLNVFDAGSFTGRLADGSPDPRGTFTNQQVAASAGIALRSRTVSIGVAGKYLWNTLDGAQIQGEGWGIDAGLKIQLLDALSVGIAGQNIAGRFWWNDINGTTGELAYTLRAGVAMEFGFEDNSKVRRNTVLGAAQSVRQPAKRFAMLSLDGSFSRFDDEPRLILGGEITPFTALTLRGGFPLYGHYVTGTNFLGFQELSAGASLRIVTDELPFFLQIDYAATKSQLNLRGVNHTVAVVVEL